MDIKFNKPNRAMFNVWMDPDTIKALGKIAKKEGVTAAEVARQLLKNAIKQYQETNQ